MHKGRVVFGAMEEVVFGRPAADAIVMPAHTPREAVVAASMGRPGKDAADVLDDFIRGLGMPRSLQDVRIGPAHFDRIAELAMATPWIPRNSRRIDPPAQVREILLLAA